MDCCLRLTIKLYSTGFWIYRFFFPYKYEPVANHVSASKLPWLFVGIETYDGNIIDKTEEAQRLVDQNIIISPTTIIDDIHNVKRCFYLDSTTLKEEEIPAEGITINDS
jgi:hypothetical protein